MAIQSVTCLVRIAPRTIDVRVTYIDRTSRRKFEGRGLQVTEVSGCQYCSIMTDRASNVFTVYMPVMLTGIVAVVLRSPGSMAGGTLRVDIERAG